MQVAELKEHLKDRKLSPSGLKPELAERLKKAELSRTAILTMERQEWAEKCHSVLKVSPAARRAVTFTGRLCATCLVAYRPIVAGAVQNTGDG